jgi:Fe-S oxidoreductase
VAYFVQCLTDRLYPAMGEATIAVLRACGAEVTCPAAQHCCGLPAIDSGDKAIARSMARQTIKVLETGDPDYVVSGAASCVAAIVHDYPHLFADDPLWLARAERLAAKTLDLVSFVQDVAKLPPGCLAHRERSEPITYHFFCQSANVLKLGDRPYRVLRELCGLEVRDLPEAGVCCGFGGSVSFERPDMAKHILQRKLENVDSTGARVLVTDNPGCIMHLRGGADASGRTTRVLHIAEVLAEGLPPA